MHNYVYMDDRNSVKDYIEIPRNAWTKIEVGTQLKYKRVASTIVKQGKLSNDDLRECYFRGTDSEGNLLMKADGGRKWKLAPAKIEKLYVSKISSPELKVQKIAKRVNAMHAFLISKFGNEYKEAIAKHERDQSLN